MKVKFLLNIGPLSLYEVTVKNEEGSITDKMKTTRVTKRQDIEREALKQQAIDEDMRQREEALGKMANAHVAAHMETILKQALANWSMQVQSQLGGQLPVGTPGGPGAPGAGGSAPQRRITGSQPRLGITVKLLFGNDDELRGAAAGRPAQSPRRAPVGRGQPL